MSKPKKPGIRAERDTITVQWRGDIQPTADERDRALLEAARLRDGGCWPASDLAFHDPDVGDPAERHLFMFGSKDDPDAFQAEITTDNQLISLADAMKGNTQ